MDGLTLKKLLRKADENGYAVPSFNYSDIWDFKAIVQAAEEDMTLVCYITARRYGAQIMPRQLTV